MALVVRDCSGDDLVICGDPRIVDAVDDVLQIALARCSQQDAGNALGGQVLGQASLIAPAAGVVHHDGVVDAMCGVVNGGRVVRVDDLDQGAVGEDRAVFLINGDRAFEAAVDRVAAQQRSALDDVIIRALADHDGTQAQAVAATLDENASQQAADAAKAVEHYVLWFCVGCASLANLLAQFFGDECV